MSCGIIAACCWLQDFIKYWITAYDWRKWEAQLNSMQQYTTTINGINLHFVHEPSNNKDAVPLLLLHGWPGSYLEFYKLIPLLKASGRFHIVAPSLPGRGAAAIGLWGSREGSSQPWVV